MRKSGIFSEKQTKKQRRERGIFRERNKETEERERKLSEFLIRILVGVGLIPVSVLLRLPRHPGIRIHLDPRRRTWEATYVATQGGGPRG